MRETGRVDDGTEFLSAPKACVKFWTPIDTLTVSGIKFW